MLGGRESDFLDGGPGADEVEAGAGADGIMASGRGRDRIDCGGGRDFVFVAGRGEHRFSKCEKVLEFRELLSVAADAEAEVFRKPVRQARALSRG